MSKDLKKEVRRKPSGEQGNSIPGRERSLCKGPEVGACLSCLRNRKESSEAAAE